MLQWIAVALLVVAALAYGLRRIVRRARRCDTSCADCPLARECEKRKDKD